MKKKILFTILILVFLTGCDMKYKIVINKDLTNSESINFFVSENVINEIKYKYDDNYIKERISSFKEAGEKKGYDFTYKYKNNLEIVATKENESIKINSSIMNQSYNYYDFNCNDEICLLYAIANNNIQSDDGMVYNLDLSIQVPYKVLENNADLVDKQNNTYTWHSNPGKDNSNIVLVFKKSGTDILLINKIFYFIKIGIFAIISLTIIFALIKLIIKLNRNNKPIL